MFFIYCLYLFVLLYNYSTYQDYVYNIYIYTRVIDQTYLNLLCVYTILDHMRVTEFKRKTLEQLNRHTARSFFSKKVPVRTWPRQPSWTHVP